MIGQVITDWIARGGAEWLLVVGALLAQWMRVERRLTKLETRMEDLFKINRRARREDLEEFQE